uniref:Uncharacterized protein n=1 Tax=Glossina palpalis gambiensis TaxID=67801 RepID=A0A1B0C7U5_9MUSC
SKCEELYYCIATTLKVCLSRFNNSDSNQTIHVSYAILSDEKYDTVKLPKIELREFSGDVTTWIAWFDEFTSLVHNNENRFENKKIIGNQHIKQIFEHPKIIYANAADLRESIDIMSNHLIGLKNINRLVESWDDLMVYIITSKLDPDTLNKWNQKAPIDHLPTLNY